MSIDASAAAGRSIEIGKAVPEVRLPAARDRDRADGGDSFADVLRAAAAPLTEAKARADQELGRLLDGEATDLHTVQIALTEAELKFQLLLQVRSKLVNAYHEIMQMQV